MTSGGQPVVLVVDDEESVAEIFGLWLEDDYEVRRATGGEAALDAMDEDVDAVLLDRRMPGVSGDDVLSAIRERGYRAPVAMVTAVDPDFDVLEMGFEDYLTKPVSRDALIETVERLLTLSEYDRRATEHFALAQKLATLEAGKTETELAESEAYRETRDRFEELRGELDDVVAAMDEDDAALLFSGVDRVGDEEP